MRMRISKELNLTPNRFLLFEMKCYIKKEKRKKKKKQKTIFEIKNEILELTTTKRKRKASSKFE